MKHFGWKTSRPVCYEDRCRPVIIHTTFTLQVCTLIPLHSRIHLSSTPWRWKEFDSFVVSKNLMPFVGGRRKCAGSELAKLLMAIFLKKLVTKYK
ncbi:hypothetical protein NC651_002822 [Populus alba x Populus x berolinensis]|nr:hypothetical protein NC651_002822 [Populus alba x Populus x berolinensis]